MKGLRYAIFFLPMFYGAYAYALMEPYPEIPEESGFSGYFMGGFSAKQFAGNMLAGGTFGSRGNATIDTLNESPSFDESYSYLLDGEVRYTFADAKIQVFFGGLVEEYLRYEILAKLGARGQVGNAGIVGGSILFTALPAKVWEDPYETGVDRDDTNRIIQGVRLSWADIMGLPLAASLSRARYRIDTEESGYSLEESGQLTPAQTELLVRDGYFNKFQISYRITLSENQLLVPQAGYFNYDLEGGAMSSESFHFGLLYGYTREAYRIKVRGTIGGLSADKVNPVFDETIKGTFYGAGITGFYDLSPAVENWSVVADLSYYRLSNDVSFYVTEMIALSVGMMYKF